VHEDVTAAIIGLNETKSLLAVEPLYRTCRHNLSFWVENGGDVTQIATQNSSKTTVADCTRLGAGPISAHGMAWQTG
jgi:hypothetical protein